MNSEAIIYNPKTKNKRYYRYCHHENFHLSIENFRATERILLEEVEPFLIENLELKSSQDLSTEKISYLNLIDEIKTEIKSGKYTKIVAAQKFVTDKHLNESQISEMIDLLIFSFPETFVYYFYINHTIWLGASPEIIGVLEKNIFSTISLAGTQVSEEFTKKEEAEQNIVSTYIQDILTSYNAQINIIPTQILQFGQIQHLVNEYSIEVKDDFDFEHIIHEIHPSPALSGYPKAASIAFIDQNERMDREFYTGLVSIVESENRYSFSPIRCVNIRTNQAIFYAGAGITSESKSEKEWEETLVKIQSLEKVLF